MTTHSRSRPGASSANQGIVNFHYIWILARYDVVRVRTMSYVHPTTSYVRRTMSGSISHVRHRTYDITYDIARTTSYVYEHRRCYIRHRLYDVRCRTNTAMPKAVRWRAQIQQYGFGSPGPRPEQNNVNIVCDVAYDVIDSTYDFTYDEYRTTLLL